MRAQPDRRTFSKSGHRSLIFAGSLLSTCAASFAQGGDGDAAGAVLGNDAVFRGNVYVNLAGGEVVISPVVNGGVGGVDSFERAELVMEAGQQSLWENTDVDSAKSKFPWQTTLPQVSIDWVTWGTIKPGVQIDCVEVAYATHAFDANATGVAGLDLLLSFWEDYAGFGAPATLVQTMHIEDLPGSDGVRNMWVVTIDLAGSDAVFELNPINLDDEGLGGFGFGYAWDTTDVAPMRPTGPVLVVPADFGGDGTSTGTEGAYDLYFQPWDEDQSTYFGTFLFEIPGVPFTSFYLDLVGDPDPCVADCNDDGAVSVLDFVCFQGAVLAENPAADCNVDGAWDVLDFVCFEQAFLAGCQ